MLVRMCCKTQPPVPEIPPRDDLLALQRAALANAHDLLDDAQLLLDAGRWPRAYALATLAWEELSKAQLCVLAVIMAGDMTAEDFWAEYKTHEGKLGRVLMLADVMSSAPVGPVTEHASKIGGQARSAQKDKERGLYVDYRRGTVLLPSQVSERAARRRVTEVREALTAAEVMFSPASLAAGFEQLAAFYGPLKNAIITEPDAMAAALQVALHGGSQEALQALVLGHAAIPDDEG
jgi:AbiV family abortive infection protein